MTSGGARLPREKWGGAAVHELTSVLYNGINEEEHTLFWKGICSGSLVWFVMGLYGTFPWYISRAASDTFLRSF